MITNTHWMKFMLYVVRDDQQSFENVNDFYFLYPRGTDFEYTCCHDNDILHVLFRLISNDNDSCAHNNTYLVYLANDIINRAHKFDING